MQSSNNPLDTFLDFVAIVAVGTIICAIGGGIFGAIFDFISVKRAATVGAAGGWFFSFHIAALIFVINWIRGIRGG